MAGDAYVVFACTSFQLSLLPVSQHFSLPGSHQFPDMKPQEPSHQAALAYRLPDQQLVLSRTGVLAHLSIPTMLSPGAYLTRIMV